MFSSTSRDAEGWPIEMHGLASSYEELAALHERMQDALERIAVMGQPEQSIARAALNG